jgi:hypothetical protein
MTVKKVVEAFPAKFYLLMIDEDLSIGRLAT